MSLGLSFSDPNPWQWSETAQFTATCPKSLLLNYTLEKDSFPGISHLQTTLLCYQVGAHISGSISFYAHHGAHHLLNWKSCVYRFVQHRGAISSFPYIPHPFSTSKASPELGLYINFHLCAYLFMVTGCCTSAYIFFITFCFYLFVLSSSGSSTSQKVRDWDWTTGWSSCITTISVSTWLLCVTASQCWPVQKCTF